MRRPVPNATVDSFRLRDVAPVFNLILEGSEDGHFSNLYRKPRYMAGLGIQLFSILLLGQIRLPTARWYRCKITVLRDAGKCIGFVAVRLAAYAPNIDEIYMVALDANHRRHGHGKMLLREAIGQRALGKQMVVNCLPASFVMRSLVKQLGFKEVEEPKWHKVPNVIHQYLLH